MNILVKRSAELFLARSGLLRFARSRHRNRTLVLAYHNVVPRGEQVCGDRSLHLEQDAFARQLDVLAETHDIIPLASLFTKSSTVGRPRAVITFDDAYAGALTAGVAELTRRSIPATFFVSPGFVDGGQFWWDELAAASRSVLREEVRRFVIEDLSGKHTRAREWARAEGISLPALPRHQTGAQEADLHGADAKGLFTLGAHSWSHPNLARLNGAELLKELADPLLWLRARFTNVVPWLSYPYGISSPVVQSESERAGYSGAFEIDGGWLSSNAANLFQLPRFNVPAGISAEGYSILASGLRFSRSPVAQPA